MKPKHSYVLELVKRPHQRNRETLLHEIGMALLLDDVRIREGEWAVTLQRVGPIKKGNDQ